MLLVNVISIYLLTVTVAVVFASVHVRTLSGSHFTKTALFLCFAVCFYILGYAMELNSATPEQIVFWNRIEYIGIPFVSALWLTIGFVYTGRLSRRHSILFFLGVYGVPLCTLILRLTNARHGLYFASESFLPAAGALLYVRRPGPWMVVQMVHSSLMILVTMTLFIVNSAKSAEKEPGKILLIVLASLFALSGLAFTAWKPFALPIDYMALCLPATCVIVIVAISRYDLLETKSIARDKAFEAGSDAILLINRHCRLVDYNSAAKRLFDQLNSPLDSRFLIAPSPELSPLQEVLKKSDHAVVALEIGGEERYFDVSTENIDDHNRPRGWIKSIRDVTQVHQLNEELKRQAMTDELSVLSNRRAFLKTGKEWVARAEEEGGSLHLLMMDLDHFKTVNDRFGHLTGDTVITEFAQLLKTHFPGGFIARLGGEEFAVLLADCSRDRLDGLLADFMKAAGAHLYSHYSTRFHVTVSVGLTKKQPGQTLERMMSVADRALYQSKDQGRNRITAL